jgi:8-oxo-dGTP diphosphatase
MKLGGDCIGVFAGTFIHDGKGNYLFGLRTEKCRDEHNCWDIAGGGTVEFGEAIEEAVRREVLEEVGAEVLKTEYLGYREVFREHLGTKTHWIGFDYKVLVDPSQVRIGEPDMCAELVWRPLTNIPVPKQSQMDYKIEKYRAKLQ